MAGSVPGEMKRHNMKPSRLMDANWSGKRRAENRGRTKFRCGEALKRRRESGAECDEVAAGERSEGLTWMIHKHG